MSPIWNTLTDFLIVTVSFYREAICELRFFGDAMPHKAGVNGTLLCESQTLGLGCWISSFLKLRN
uniref:Uncharacterized protein n=1 Tax=Desertifilum tharense IPPAS B-1220 TaxID=1781255 RepID=A0A1E5QE63_9CYAN|nr:hypothetical protein BH720_22310 [Desertifilum tharense IPPAS B-1220]